MNQDTIILYEMILFELVLTIPMVLCILKPIAEMFSKEKCAFVFWTLFMIRVLILAYYDSKGDPGIVYIDFFTVFFWGIIATPIGRIMKQSDLFSFGNKKNLTSNLIRDNIERDVNSSRTNSSKSIQKCDVCGKKSELSYSYCPYCGAFLLGDIVNETEK